MIPSGMFNQMRNRQMGYGGTQRMQGQSPQSGGVYDQIARLMMQQQQPTQQPLMSQPMSAQPQQQPNYGAIMRNIPRGMGY